MEEVGFEKISQQLAKLTELRIVVLDGLCVAGVLNSGRRAKSDDWLRSLEDIRQTCPKVVELDLSRNLLERWQDVEGICSTLTALRTLKLKYLHSKPHFNTEQPANVASTTAAISLTIWPVGIGRQGRMDHLVAFLIASNILVLTRHCLHGKRYAKRPHLHHCESDLPW